MVSHCLLHGDELKGLIGKIMKSRAVMGPKERPDQPGFHYFDWLGSPEELVWNYSTTTLPPKKAFFPPSETLFSFRLEDPPVINLVRDDQPFVLAGVHPCDLAAIELLDMAYAQHPPEVRWPAERERGIIIGMDCHPDEYCFCTSVGTSENRRPCDLFLTPVEQGYLVEVHTPEGNRLLKNVSTSPFSDRDLREAREWRAGKAAKISAVLDASMAEIASILEKGGFGDIFEETAERCYSCGSCNTTCPTCFCFIMEEHLDADLQTGLRKRTWDSCQLPEFAKVVDGHNFRGERWQRVKHRWHRKFLYLYRQFERPYCTGCGRCGRACTADINIVDITNRLISHSRKEDPDA